jgi:teichuronic acid exporter
MASEPKFKHAVKWAFVMNLGEKGFSTIFTFVLAYKLGPSDFGIVALAMIYILFVQMFLEQGLAAALIQRKNLRPEHLDSVFWMDLVVSVFLVALSVGFSGWWSVRNHTPQLAAVISVLSLTIPIEGLAIVQRSILQREMDFRSLSVRSNVSIVIGGIVGLAMAYKGFGVWSLVGQKLTADVSALAILWKLSHWRPRFHFSISSFKELLGFSSSNFVAKLGAFAEGQADAVFMGLFFTPAAVGIYRFAMRLRDTVADFGVIPLQTVSLSEFSRFQDNPEELRRSLLVVVRMVSILTIPALAGLAAISKPLCSMTGEKWVPGVNALIIVCFSGILTTLMRFVRPMLQAISRPGFVAAWVWFQTSANVAMLIMIARFFKHMTLGKEVTVISVARLLSVALVGWPILVYTLRRFCKISAKDLFVATWPSLASGIAAAAPVMLLNASGLLNGLKPVFTVGVESAVGGVAALAVMFWLDAQLRNLTLAWVSKFFRVAMFET